MSSSLDLDFVDFLYRWNRFEQPEGFEIVDIDMLVEEHQHPGTFSSRSAVLKEARSLDERSGETTDDFVRAKIRAARTYLEALENNPEPFESHVEGMLGIRPAWIDESVLEDQRAVCAELLRVLGYSYSPAGVEQFDRDHGLVIEEVQRQFGEVVERFVPLIKSALGTTVDMDYDAKVVDVDAYWINWTSTNEKGKLLLRFNVNQRHKWWRGMPEWLGLHEIGGHALQTVLWKRALADDPSLPRSYGIISTFSPEVYANEGMANMLAFLLPQLPVSDYGMWAVNRCYMRELALNNAYGIAIAEGEIEAFDYLQRWAPFASDSDRSGIKDLLNNHMLRSYLHSYTLGSYHHRVMAEELSEADRLDYLRHAFTRPLTPKLVERWLNKTSLRL